MSIFLKMIHRRLHHRREKKGEQADSLTSGGDEESDDRESRELTDTYCTRLPHRRVRRKREALGTAARRETHRQDYRGTDSELRWSSRQGTETRDRGVDEGGMKGIPRRREGEPVK